MATSRYHVHRLDTGLAVRREALQTVLDGLEGDVVAIVPNVMQFPFARINYLLIVERTDATVAVER